ncbi:PREDICTED: uncharacterized protein LOC104793917 [Camelina sativa]|uniref:Uncharacterized protein LOC104793917 n=1 Tax=Camelina sativa TaxID=90675 RepID=A0ABM0ZPD9_CAMSA|nr:PREDICTED: uncharacterized protein LOC104793917 [Camelina sativa]
MEIQRRTISPYDLTSNDNPGSIISRPLLRGDNYEEWAINLETALYSRKKFGFLDGSIKAPTKGSPDYDDWKPINALIVSWIKMTIEPKLLSNISHKPLARDLWKHIRKRFRVTNGPRVQQLRKELANCQQAGMSIEAYYGKLTKIWDCLGCYRPPLSCTCGLCTCNFGAEEEKTREEDKVHDFVMGLDEEVYGMVKSNLLSQEPLPTLEYVYLKVTQDEDARLKKKNPEEKSENMAFVAQTQKPKYRGDDRDVGIVCSNCGRTGHRSETCFHILGFPEWWGDRPQNRVGRGRGVVPSTGISQGRGGVARANVARVVGQTNIGVANVAVTDADRTAVCGLTDKQWLNVKRVMNAAAIGADEQSSGKLLSPSWIIDSGVTHHLTCKKEILTNLRTSTPTQIILADGRTMVGNTVGTVVLNSHLRLIDVFYIENLGFDLISVSQLMEENNCVIQMSVPFCVVQDRTTRMLIGIGRPVGGLMYFQNMEIVATAKGHTSQSVELWHRRLGHPSLKVVQKLSGFGFISNSSDLSNKFGKEVRTIRSDNGSEFMSLTTYFLEEGIQHETSCVGTPQRNGRVERKHRHLLNVARAVMFEGHLPVEFWGECALAAAYLINRTPSMVLNGYPHGKKGSRVFDLEKEVFFVSRYVVFREDTIHFLSTQRSITEDPFADIAHAALTTDDDQGDSDKPYPIAAVVSCSRFSENHKVFLAAITSAHEPRSFAEAMKDDRWKNAVGSEIGSLELNKTWTLEDLPKNKKAIGCQWVFHIKHHSDGTIERYKVRLVVLGNRQVAGVDYGETFAPVVKMTTVRSFLSVVAARNWEVHQMDVHNAFLHGDLEEEVYMTLPPGFPSRNDGKVCRLRKSLYGLKQAPRCWFAKLASSLEQYGFEQSFADYSLFIYKKNGVEIRVLVYVDDLVITGNTVQAIEDFKKYLSTCFYMKDLGVLKYFLGIEVARSPKGIYLSQRKYVLDILAETGLLDLKSIFFPLEQHHRLGLAVGPFLSNPEQYRRLVGPFNVALGDFGFIALGIRRSATVAEALCHRRRRHSLLILNQIGDKLDRVWSRQHGPPQQWSKAVWFSNSTPKYAFLTWLAALNRLTTGDRMSGWTGVVSTWYVFLANVHFLWGERNGRRHGEAPKPHGHLVKLLDRVIGNRLSTLTVGESPPEDVFGVWLATRY